MLIDIKETHDRFRGIEGSFARAMEDAGCAPLGEPLTNEALAAAIVCATTSAPATSTPAAAEGRGE